jgi:hypothetical protein
MANFGAVPLNIQSPGTHTGYNTSKMNLHYTVTYSGGNFYHYKTNIVRGGSWMGMIEFVGHNFGINGSCLPIRSAICFYAYSATLTLINVGLNNAYPGITAQTVYQSADNYAVLVVSSDSYYSGWVLNAYQANPTTPGYDLQILAVAQTSSTAAAF